MVIHHTGGSHLCLLYIVNADHTTYLSAAKISDELADWVPTSTTVPGPRAALGDGRRRHPRDADRSCRAWSASGACRSRPTYVEYYLPIEDNYDYWVEEYHDSVSTTAAQAAARTAGILEERRNSHVTHRVSVLLNPDQVHLIAAGMSIQIKSAVTFTERPATPTSRAASPTAGSSRASTGATSPTWTSSGHRCAWRRARARSDPSRRSSPSRRPAVTDYLWTFATEVKDDTTDTHPVGTLATNWHAGYVHTHVIHPGINTLTPLPTITPGPTRSRARFGRMVGSPYNSGGVRINVYSINTGVDTLIGQTSLKGYYDGSEETISLTFPSGADHLRLDMPYNFSIISEMVISHGSAIAAFEGTPRTAGGHRPRGHGRHLADLLPVRPPARGADRRRHTHRRRRRLLRGRQRGGGAAGAGRPPAGHHDAHDASAISIDDAGTYFTGTDVEAALQELGAGGVTADEISALGFVGEILISDTPSTPLIFADLLQNEAEDDLIYGP